MIFGSPGKRTSRCRPRQWHSGVNDPELSSPSSRQGISQASTQQSRSGRLKTRLGPRHHTKGEPVSTVMAKGKRGPRAHFVANRGHARRRQVAFVRLARGQQCSYVQTYFLVACDPNKRQNDQQSGVAPRGNTARSPKGAAPDTAPGRTASRTAVFSGSLIRT